MGLQRLSTSWISERGVREVTVAGEIDISTAPELERQLCEARTDDPFSVIVSLAQCTYCDSSGLSTLLRHARKTPIFVIVSPEGTDVRRLLRISGVDESIAVAGDLAAARAIARSRRFTRRGDEALGERRAVRF